MRRSWRWPILDVALAAAPGAVVIAWGFLAWVPACVLKVLLLFVPRPEAARKLPLKTPDVIAALERELGIGSDE